MKTDVKPPHKLKQEQERVFYHGDGGAALRTEEEKWIGKLNGCFQHLMQVSENVKAYE